MNTNLSASQNWPCFKEQMNLHVTINRNGWLKSANLVPASVWLHSYRADNGQEVHSVRISGAEVLVVAFLSSLKSAKLLQYRIRTGKLRLLTVTGKVLALGVQRHPRGWPEKGGQDTFLERAEQQKITRAQANIPQHVAEVFGRLPAAAFTVLPRIPCAGYEYMHYGDIWQERKNAARIDLVLQPARHNALSRLSVLLNSADSAERLGLAITQRRVQVLRPNSEVLAIIHEHQPKDRNPWWEIDGLNKIPSLQLEALGKLGLRTRTDGRVITGPLTWASARALSSVQLF